jgi:hypothetical protein
LYVAAANGEVEKEDDAEHGIDDPDDLFLSAAHRQYQEDDIDN